MSAWKCTGCGHIWAGSHRLHNCPGAWKDSIPSESLVEDLAAMTKWKDDCAHSAETLAKTVQALTWERDGLLIDKATLQHDLNNARASAQLLMERIKR